MATLTEAEVRQAEALLAGKWTNSPLEVDPAGAEFSYEQTVLLLRYFGEPEANFVAAVMRGEVEGDVSEQPAN